MWWSKNSKNNKPKQKAPLAKEKSKDKAETQHSHLKEETLHTIIAVGFFVLAIFLVLSAGPIGKGGRAGIKAFEMFHYLFGIGYYLLPIVFFILCVSFFRSLQKKLALTHSIGGVLFFLSSLALTNIISKGNGGIVGGFISKPLLNTFDTYVSMLILIALIIISLLTIFDAPIRFTFIKSLFKKKEISEGEDDTDPEIIISNPEQLNMSETSKSSLEQEKSTPLKNMGNNVDEFGISPLLLNGKEFVPPPLSLLEQDRGKPGVGDIKANSNIIKRTLANFGINVEMDEISIGPSYGHNTK